jgi:hypothetical protein
LIEFLFGLDHMATIHEDPLACLILGLQLFNETHGSVSRREGLLILMVASEVLGYDSFIKLL